METKGLNLKFVSTLSRSQKLGGASGLIIVTGGLGSTTKPREIILDVNTRAQLIASLAPLKAATNAPGRAIRYVETAAVPVEPQPP